ncbi:PSP1 C-terminal conserved region containing protein, putative [Leishmania guyanensis]
MATREHPNPCGVMKTFGSTKTTLTSDPRDLTEIPSLFQTFGDQDASSGEDDDSGVLVDTHRAGYGGRSAVTAASSRDLDATSAFSYAQRSDHVARPSSSLVGHAGQGSLSSRRSLHSFNHSSHNPYILLESSDVNHSEQESLIIENSSKAVRRRHSSYSNNTSQNALMFEFTSASTSTFTPADVGSSKLFDSGMVRRRPSQQLQQQSVDAPSTGFWSDGNRMKLSTTDARPISMTTVGTLTCSDKAQNFNVNVKQRVRPSANSTNCSLNTSNSTMPVVQPVSSAPGSTPAVAHISSIAETIPAPLLGSTSNASRFVASGSSTLENHSSSGPSSQKLDRHCIAVTAKVANAVDGAEMEIQKRSGAETGTYTQPHSLSKPLHYQYPPQQQRQQHPQQQQYGYAAQTRPYPLQQQPYIYGGCPSQNYPFIPSQPAYYAQVSASPQQQQQCYSPPVPNSKMTAHQGSTGCTPVQIYGEVPYTSIPQPAQAPYMGDARTMMSTYGYLSIPPIARYTGTVLGSLPDVQRAAPRQGAGSAKVRVQHPPALAETADPTPVTAASAHNKPTKVKTQHADPAQLRHENAKRAVIPTSKVGSYSMPTVAQTTAVKRPTNSSSKKLGKKQDEARFHVNYDEPIRFFVVVKRKREGQRYACSLSAEEVPVGSHVLVEGDRGADIGEVLSHVSIEQMARDCAIVERLRQRAMERMLECKTSILRNTNDDADRVNIDESNLPQLTGEAALEYVMSIKTWPRLIGPTTAEDIANLGPQLEAEKQAYATAKPIVQQLIENRYLQRVARNEAVLAATAAVTEASKTSDAVTAVPVEPAEQSADSASTDNSERRRNLTPLSEEELKMLELSREVTLVDCEYQFTREKITLYVSRPSRNMFVDFRVMQRKLFRTFRCRIWIAYIDEVTHDKDAPESFVFVPFPSMSAAAAAAPTDGETDEANDVV